MKGAMSADECALIVKNAVKYGQTDAPWTTGLKIVWYIKVG
jgi:hypothetical protein